jgi:hypothetical protein
VETTSVKSRELVTGGERSFGLVFETGDEAMPA